MKKLCGILVMLAMLFSLQSCSDKDELESVTVDPDKVAGTWCLINLRGWQYDEDNPTEKEEYNFSLNYSIEEDGTPVGHDADFAQALVFTRNFRTDEEPNTFYFTFGLLAWNSIYENWDVEEMGVLTKLKGDKLYIDSEPSTILELNESIMVLYEKNSEGESYATFKKIPDGIIF